MRKIAVIEVKGGLGNQLFILNFIQYLENKNFKVYTLTNFYSNQKDNPIGTDIRDLYLDSGFVNLNIPKLKFSNFLSYIFNKKNQNLNLIQKIFFRISELLICYANDKNLITKLNSSKRIFFIDGYFQNYKFLQSNISLIDRLSYDPKFNFNLPVKSENIAVVHIRRKDYIDISEELNTSYYENALKLLKKTVGNIKFDVFTDDIEWCEKNPLFNDAISIKQATHKNTINDFIEMTRYKYFVISNSTYSYMAAYLSSWDNKIVISPKPWFKKLDFIDYDLILNPDWEKIKNE